MLTHGTIRQPETMPAVASKGPVATHSKILQIGLRVQIEQNPSTGSVEPPALESQPSRRQSLSAKMPSFGSVLASFFPETRQTVGTLS